MEQDGRYLLKVSLENPPPWRFRYFLVVVVVVVVIPYDVCVGTYLSIHR